MVAPRDVYQVARVNRVNASVNDLALVAVGAERCAGLLTANRANGVWVSRFGTDGENLLGDGDFWFHGD